MGNNLTATHIKFPREFKSIQKRKLETTVDNAARPTLMKADVTNDILYFIKLLVRAKLSNLSEPPYKL